MENKPEVNEQNWTPVLPSEYPAVILKTLYDEFGGEWKITVRMNSLAECHQAVIAYGNDFQLSLDRQKVSRNTEDPNAETRTPLDEEGNEIKPDAGGKKPGDTGYWHVKRIEFSKLHEGKSKVVLSGVIGQDEKPAEFPFLQNNMPLSMVKQYFDIIMPDIDWEAFLNDPHDNDVNWKVSYRYANKLNTKGYYFKNITGVEEWS